MAKPVVLRFLADTSQLTGAIAKVKSETMTLGGPLGAASASLRRFGATGQKVGGQLSRSLTLPIVAIAGISAKLATDFEDSMSKIEGLVGVSHSQVKAWGSDVLALARKLPQAPEELADALFFVTSAGFRGKEAMDVLEASARASAAGLGETKVVADAATSAINAYGIKNLSAKAATDVLVAAVREGKMPAEDLAGALGRVIAPSQALGVGFDQVGASIASMTRLGLSADESATALRAVLMGVLKPSSQAGEALAAIGYKGDELRKVIREKGLLAGLQDLRTKAGNNTAALGQLFPNVRALNGFLIMTGESAGATSTIFDNLRKSTGSSDKAFRVASKTAKFQFHAALSSLQATAIQLGAVLLPMLVKIARGFASLADKIGKFSPNALRLVLVFALLAAAIGPVVWIVSSLATALGAILTIPGLIVVGIVALVAAFVLLYNKNKTFHDLVVRVWETIRLKVTEVTAWIAKTWREALEAVAGWWRENGAAIEEAVGHIWHTVGPIVMMIVDLVMTNFRMMSAFFRMTWEVMWNVVKIAFTIIKNTIMFWIHVINGDWSKAWNDVKDLWAGVWNGIVGILSSVWNGIRSIIGEGVNAVIDIINGFLRVWNAIPGHKDVELMGHVSWGKSNAPELSNGGGGVVRFMAIGGVVDRPTRAMIGEAGPEAVIPLSRPNRAAEIMRQAGLAPTGTDGRGSGLTIQTMNITALDPRRAARIAAEEWAWTAKTGGY